MKSKSMRDLITLGSNSVSR